MEDDKRWALISEVGGDAGYLEELAAVLERRFHLVGHREFLRDPERHGPRVQVLFNWKFLPAVEPSLLRSLPALRLVASGGVGVDHLDVAFINGLGVKVANTPGVVGGATADLAMGLLLASARKILHGHQIAVDPNTTQLPQSLMGVEVSGATLGIVGMGDVGYKIAQRSLGFEMKVLYHNRTRRSVGDEQAVGAVFCPLEDLLRRADFVVVAVKLTADTRRLIGRRELSLMKPTATLVNVSRGLVVDQEALVAALQSGGIRAAALDVTHPEPLPRDHPLLFLPNVLITPHIGISTHATARAIVERMLQNGVAAVDGRPVPDEVRLP
ncbi:glyoxylate/hydroxypyruvate reductase B-like [Pseudoliparis swirei]|uniref:glyoxylate/hydroxypyruvate reductase B-like n=1 Tax=Pseudoliparis swirei TaxID=2059687 RepID=UPI0024BE2153|nr:glyoxylate/hydroxypyruvate reductase B-like [Pseudoliparis swirei]